MKTKPILMLLTIFLPFCVIAEESFVLRQNSNGELWGPYELRFGQKIADGSFSLSGVSTNEFNITGFVRGIKRTFGPFPFTNSAKVSISDVEYTLLCGSGLHRTASVAEEQAKVRRKIAAHSRGMRLAISSAKKAHSLGNSIEILKQAIDRWSKASIREEAEKLLLKYRRDLRFNEEQLAKGLIYHRGEWMTPQQKQESEVLNYIRSNYGENVRLFYTEEEASFDAKQFNQQEHAYIENRKAKVNLWTEYSMTGAPNPGPPVTFHIAKVAYDSNLDVWVRYLEVLARF